MVRDFMVRHRLGVIRACVCVMRVVMLHVAIRGEFCFRGTVQVFPALTPPPLLPSDPVTRDAILHLAESHGLIITTLKAADKFGLLFTRI